MTTAVAHEDPKVAEALGELGYAAGLYHTGGGIYVLEVALDGSVGADGFHTAASGPVLWVTRDGDEWLLAVKDLSDETDMGQRLDETTYVQTNAKFVGEDAREIAAWIAAYCDRLAKISPPRTSLVHKHEDETSDGTILGPLFVRTASPDGETRYEPVGESVIWYDRRQAVAVARAFGLRLEAE